MSEAEAMYRRAFEHIPYPDSLMLFTWGRSLEKTGQEDAAVAAYERAKLIDPENKFIQQRLDALRP
jgi:predicted TPR repeat methyltransferase